MCVSDNHLLRAAHCDGSLLCLFNEISRWITCRNIFPFECNNAPIFRASAKLEWMFVRASTSKEVRGSPSLGSALYPFVRPWRPRWGFLGPSGEPFSPLSEKTNIRSKQKVTCLDENAHARSPGAATTGRTEVLLLHDPFVPPTSLKFLFLFFSFSCPFYPIHRFCSLLRGRFTLETPSGRYPPWTENHRLELHALLRPRGSKVQPFCTWFLPSWPGFIKTNQFYSLMCDWC